MIKKLEVYERVLKEADYVIVNNATVRQTAKEFGMSKSCVYRDLSELLPQYNLKMSAEVISVFQVNKALRHIRGGQATKRKYAK